MVLVVGVGECCVSVEGSRLLIRVAVILCKAKTGGSTHAHEGRTRPPTYGVMEEGC